MSYIRINEITIKNYRSFGNTEQTFVFPDRSFKKPVAIVGYNNCGKTNLMNAILYGIGHKYISETSFEKKDFYNCDLNNIPYIESTLNGSSYRDEYGEKTITDTYKLTFDIFNDEISAKMKPSFFGKNKHYGIFYINFHEIKKEISTQKTSWGNLTSFLAKHLKKLIDTDPTILSKKEDFIKTIKEATFQVKENTQLSSFIEQIKINLDKNLRDNSCDIDFCLPDYEDIFLEMLFKVGIGGDPNKLVPVDHLGDGYISMFVMAVIQTIGENADDKCLFLFEEPESFLHENHQEYFYNNVLCRLTENGHQVIYTTHSDKMVDIFTTQGIIRLEMDPTLQQTIKKFNDIETPEEIIDPIRHNSQFLRVIEPNLNRLLFSQKVILVEGPNDVMAYKFAIEKEVENRCIELKKFAKSEDLKRFAKNYLNFHNITIIPHHGKGTAILLVEICKHFGIDCFVINDWDLSDSFPISEKNLQEINSLEELKQKDFYTEITTDSQKSQITSNWKIINAINNQQFHFNKPKLEGVLEFEKVDDEDIENLKYKKKGDSSFLWGKLNEIKKFNLNFFPATLVDFLEVNAIQSSSSQITESYPDDIPF